MKSKTKWLACAVALGLTLQGCSSDDDTLYDESAQEDVTAQPEDEGEDSSTQDETITGTIKGHEYVDLGLSVKWAACNVGASEPSDYGSYYAWGEIAEPSGLNYSSDYCRLYGRSEYKGMAVTEENIKGNPDFDAAAYNWGGTWRMPTEEEMAELKNRCQWTWTMRRNGVSGYGVSGCEVTGPNGNSIFLPAAGYYNGTTLNYVGECGYYWSSSPLEGNMDRAYYLYFYRFNFDLNDYNRYYGQSVRPVSE